MQKKNYLAFVLFFLTTNFLFSQYQFDQIKFEPIKEGLPKRGIRTIVQDADGFMWFGTSGAGLFRFDGSNFKQYVYENKDTSSINGNFIYSNLIDEKGRMWVGTNLGLDLFNPEMGNFKRIKSINDFIPNEVLKIIDIFPLDEDHLLLGTINFGIIKLNIETGHSSLIECIPFENESINVTDILRFNGKVYAASSKGLLEYNNEENNFILSELSTKKGVKKIPHMIESATLDKENNLWLGTAENGLVKVAYANSIFHVSQFEITKKRIMTFLVTDENQLFCSAENDGLFLIEKSGEGLNEFTFKKLRKDFLQSNSIWSLFQDSQNRIWAGSFNKGVSVYDDLCNKFEEATNLLNTNSLNARAVTSIIEDSDGKIWIGIDGGGISIYHPKTKKIQSINSAVASEYSGLTSDAVTRLFQDKKENIWVGTWEEGIFYLEKGSNNFINYTRENTNGDLASNRIECFAEDSEGRLWIGTHEKGLIYFTPKTKKFIHVNTEAFKNVQISNKQVRSITLDSEDGLWLGTSFGLFKVKYQEEDSGELSFEITSLKEPMFKASQNHPSTPNTSSIYLTSNNRVVVGTEGAGIFIFNQDGEDLVKYENENFQPGLITSIIQGADNTMWVSGANGIANINLESNKVIVFDQHDGYLSNYFHINSGYSSKDGVIYYGNDQKLNYFKPDEIKFNTEPVKLQLTQFKIFNKEITPFQKGTPLSKDILKTKKITLGYEQRVFSIGYVGIGYTRSEKNQYAYQLEGVDPSWRYVGDKRSATYTNLEPGKYTFRVKATNNDNLWTTDPLELEIKILPPWWASNLAYLLYGLLLLMIIFATSRFYKQRIKSNQIIQFEREKRIQEEQLSQKKVSFFTNISHEFRTPLTLIINPLEDIVNEKNVELPNEIKRKAQIAYKNSSRLNRLINELMDFRKIESNKMTIQVEMVEVVNQLKEILEYFREEAIGRNINLEFKTNTDSLIAWLDISMLEKIIFNLLSNAFKVTPNHGSITVTITEKKINFPNSDFKQEKEGLEISVGDTGGGLTENEISKIFQRFSQINRTKNTHYGGTGIGLAMVKAMTLLHSGNVEVTSKAGRGSEFKVSFLLGSEHFKYEEISQRRYYGMDSQNQIPSSIIKSSLEKIEPQEINNTNPNREKSTQSTILIVEDNVELRNYLKLQLEKDYHVLLAENGELAYEVAIKETPHLILTDVMMPVMDGFELCKKIKEDLKTSHIPLVMLTAKTMSEDKLQGINLGADAYLGKPIEFDLLQSTIDQLLSSRQILIDKYSIQNDIKVNKDSIKEITSLDNVFVKDLMKYINENLGDSSLTVESISDHFFLSRSQLYRKTKSLTGITVNELIRKTRLEEAHKMIKLGEGNIGEIAFKVGFTSPSYFAKCFKDEFGKLPKEIN